MTTRSHALSRAEPLLLIAVGGFVGASLRYLVGQALPVGFPWGTLTVNALGSFALGVLTAVPVEPGIGLVFATGFCGAFTFETVRLYETGRRRRATAAQRALTGPSRRPAR